MPDSTIQTRGGGVGGGAGGGAGGGGKMDQTAVT